MIFTTELIFGFTFLEISEYFKFLNIRNFQKLIPLQIFCCTVAWPLYKSFKLSTQKMYPMAQNTQNRSLFNIEVECQGILSIIAPSGVRKWLNKVGLI